MISNATSHCRAIEKPIPMQNPTPNVRTIVITNDMNVDLFISFYFNELLFNCLYIQCNTLFSKVMKLINYFFYNAYSFEYYFLTHHLTLLI